ncbi:MAG TPA: hypothetical protein VK146_04550 [Tabrizicola sp.]|nr:hypothetical protein [Tabrizicola sp.]
MKMLLRALLLTLLAGPVAAEPADCPALVHVLEGLSGYAISAPPAGSEDGWCVFDRAVLKAAGAPDLAVERFRLRGEGAEDVISELAVEAGGVRLAPGLGQREMDPILRETLRLQTAQVALVIGSGPQGLTLRNGRLQLTGGTELRVEADIAGAGLKAGSLLVGRLTWAKLDWRNDGKLLRPALEAVGQGLLPGATGPKAIDAARSALRVIVDALPETLVGEEGRRDLAQLIDALPQGRGRLVLEFRSDSGIGAAQMALAAFADDPAGAEALARLFADATLEVDWVPGLAP